MINLKEGRKGFESISNYKVSRHVIRKDANLAGVKCSWFIPDRVADDGIAIYIHGGGFIFGSVTSHAPMVSHIAHSINRKILFIDYRLAPEHPFPSGINDCVAVIDTLCKEDQVRFGIIGDSAGGNIAMATQLKLKEEKGPSAEYTILISPWVNLECDTPSYTRNKNVETILSQPYLKEAARLYAGDHDLKLPLISPVYGNFEGLARVLILCGTNEILEDDSVQLRQRLEDNGVKAELRLFPVQPHVWPFLDIRTTASQLALSDISDFVHFLTFGK